MKQGMFVSEGTSRPVKLFRLREWDGLRDSDEIKECDLDRKIYVRDGELHIVSDAEYDNPSKDFVLGEDSGRK